MRFGPSVWGRESWRWIVPLLLTLAGLALLYLYGSVYAGQLQVGGQRLEGKAAELEDLRSRISLLEGTLTAAGSNRQAVESFYRDRLGTERQRLTEVIAGVKELGRRAGLEPTVIRYPEQALEEYGLLERSMVFGVEGGYQELRRFINLLELSDLFLSLDEIRVSSRDGGGASLRINLVVSTLFWKEGQAPVASETQGEGS